MQLKISTKFANDFKMITDHSLKKKVKNVLETLKTAKNVGDITQFRAIDGNKNAFKMGVGFYYLLGVMIAEDEMVLMRFLHREEVMQILNIK